MRVVKVSMSEQAYDKLAAERKKDGLPNVASLLLKKAGALDDQPISSKIVQTALAGAKKKPAGEKFKLRDLFPRAEWEAFPKTDRIAAGQMFHDEVNTAVHGVRAAGKSTSNHRYYARG